MSNKKQRLELANFCAHQLTQLVFDCVHDKNGNLGGQEFGKEHKNVLADIRSLDCSDDFNALNFQPVKYTDEKGEKRPMFLMTKDGFIFLVMGYRGKKAAAIKEAYIQRFNDTEQDLKTVEYMLNIVEDLSTRLRIAIKYSDVFFKKKITDEASHTDEIATQQQK